MVRPFCPPTAQAEHLCWACRLANHLAEDVGKLGFRGTICNNEAKWEHAKVGHAPPIWFIFSGETLAIPLCYWLLAMLTDAAQLDLSSQKSSGQPLDVCVP